MKILIGFTPLHFSAECLFTAQVFLLPSQPLCVIADGTSSLDELLIKASELSP